ncbi:MAG: hypothetical protein K8F91_05465, partial [Candidatus Obscuribacterales bacterium]|nr:hypothetical protein [Candidatus Obscuribacterales bacterium]
MKFENQKGPLSQIEADVLVIALFKGEDPEMVLRELDAKLSLDMLKNLKKFLSEEDFKASDFETRTFPTGNMHPTGRILIVGMPEKVDASALRKAAANLARKLKLDNEPKNTCFYLRTRKAVPTKGKKPSSKTRSKGELQAQQEYLSAFVEGLMLGGYDFDKYKTKDKKNKSKKKSEAEIEIAGLDISDKDFAASVKLGTTLSEATNFAKTLIAEPAGYMTPTRLAKEAENMAESSGLSIKVLDKPQIKKLGMGAFLGVAMGSDEPARLIVLKYTASKAKKTIALVGKGITFDSGGLSLKPAANMERMKYDMSGAAAVLGAMKAIGILKPHVSVLAVVPATENMPSGRALRPGDVLKSMNGKTIEVNNTDAEGRLVLADALTYAQSQKVDEIIDVATLTGAIVQALG